MVCNQSPGMIDWLLELGAARVARPVLRGGGGSDATSLPNQVGRYIFRRSLHEPRWMSVMLQFACGSMFGNRTQAGIILDNGDGDAFRCLGSLTSLYICTGQAIAGNLAMCHDVDYTAWRHVSHMYRLRR